MANKTQEAQKLSQISPDLLPGEEEQYLHIELDLEETEDALRLARKEKHYRIERQRYFDRISKPVQYITHTAEELFSLFVESGFKFADAIHEAKVKNLCCYFSKDPRSPYDLNKGLILTGSVGNGKTSLMKFFVRNQLHGFRIERMIDLVSDYKIHGEVGVKGYNSNVKTTPNIYGLEMVGYCFDDLGTEEIPAKHFGESKNVFSEILLARYENRELTPYNSTHATTNKGVKQLEDIYGTRVYDRMKEMFNIVNFTHGSFRG